MTVFSLKKILVFIATNKTRSNYAMRLFITASLFILATSSHTLCGESVITTKAKPHTTAFPLQPEQSSRFILKARNEALLGAEVSARITNIPFKLGQAFKKGDVILSLDDTISKAGYQRAVALEKSAAQKFNTVSDMFSRKDASIVALEEARSELQSAKATTTVAKKQLDDCQIIAPFDGRIENVLVNEHELVEKGQPLLKITADSVLLAGFLLPEKYFPSIRKGMKVKLFLPLLQKQLTGNVSLVSPTIEPSSNTFELYVEIPNKSSQLCAGMNGWIAHQQFEQKTAESGK